MTPPLHPRRRLAFPFLVVLYPLLWLAVRGTQIGGDPGLSTNSLGLLVFVAVAVVVSYLAAVVVATYCPARTLPEWARQLTAPSNGTLVVVAVVSVALGAYIGGTFVFEFPSWVESAARAAGLVLGWPLMVATLGVYAVGNAFPALRPPFLVELVATIAGVALSTVWLFVVSSWLAALVRRTARAASKGTDA